ncbi:MAG: MFS transporter [Candidatus Rokubacteria bacterium]|nr:MFS transporter [Candidatus Rokubacteria bacterium]
MRGSPDDLTTRLAPRPALTSYFHGWVIVGGAFVVLFTAYGAQYSFGIFFSALLEEFHWSRASLSGAFALYGVLYPVCGFPAGRLTDRWGPRAVIAVGGVLLGTALAGMSLVTQLWQPYVLYGSVAALGMGTAYVPCNTTVVKWFVRRRGLAVGLASAGGSVGTFVLPPLAQLLVTAVGWRTAYVIFGAAIFVVLNLVARVMRRDPESVGLHPDGDPAPLAAGGAEPGWPLRRALGSRAFWMLAAAFSATWTPVFIPLVHVVPFARDLGHSPLTGAWVVSALGGGAVAGRLVLGGISDRIGRKAGVGIAMALQAVSFLGFLLAGHGLTLLFGAALLFGFSYGAVSTLFPAIVGDYFGRGQAGALVGFLFMVAGSMAGWGPLIAGALYDATGGYDFTWVLAAGLNVLALSLLALSRPPRVG